MSEAMAGAAAIASVAGTVMSMASSGSQSNAAKAQSEALAQQQQNQAAQDRYQAQVADLNQQQSETNAKMESDKAAKEAYNLSIADRGKMGGIVAAQAANGVDVGAGSAADVTASSRQLISQDVNNLWQNALITNMYPEKVKATQYGEQSELYKAGASGYDTSAAMTLQAGQQQASAYQTQGLLGGIEGFSKFAQSMPNILPETNVTGGEMSYVNGTGMQY